MKIIRKRILSLVAISMLIYSFIVPTRVNAANNQFHDIIESDYYYDPIIWALNNNITTGINANKFGPDNNCTRAQVVTFLWRAAGQPATSIVENPFVDVDLSSTFYQAILWAYENGITTGIDENRFNPEGTCKREQIVTFLWRFAGQPSGGGNPFVDVDSNSTFYPAIVWASANGITANTNNRFYGYRNCTRAQTVTFLYRYLNPGITTTSRNHTPVFYSQLDNRWSGISFGNYSFGSTGCGPTSIAMAINGILQNGVTPYDVANYLYNNTQEFNRSAIGNTGLAIKYGAEHWGLRTMGISNYDLLVRSLKNGCIVVIAENYGTFCPYKGATHAICVWGYSNGMANVYDPSGPCNGRYSVSTIWNEQSTDPIDTKGGYVGYAIYK